jgi:hypothetical protein
MELERDAGCLRLVRNHFHSYARSFVDFFVISLKLSVSLSKNAFLHLPLMNFQTTMKKKMRKRVKRFEDE